MHSALLFEHSISAKSDIRKNKLLSHLSVTEERAVQSKCSKISLIFGTTGESRSFLCCSWAWLEAFPHIAINEQMNHKQQVTGTGVMGVLTYANHAGATVPPAHYLLTH